MSFAPSIPLPSISKRTYASIPRGDHISLFRNRGLSLSALRQALKEKYPHFLQNSFGLRAIGFFSIDKLPNRCLREAPREINILRRCVAKPIISYRERSRAASTAQEQAAAPDIEELTPAEKRWAQEELEEERRIEAAMNDWTEKKGKPFVKAL